MKAESNGNSSAKDYSGIRFDHVAEQIRIRDCTLNRNAKHGLQLEIAKGPVSVDNSLFKDNRSGISLGSSTNINIRECDLINNWLLQLEVKKAPRLVSDSQGGNTATGGAGNLRVGVGEEWRNKVDIPGTRQTLIEGCLIKTHRNDSYLISKELNAGRNHLTEWVRLETAALNNVYYHPDNRQVFDISNGSRSRNWVDFATWKGKVVQAPNTSRFTETDSAWKQTR